MFSLGLWLSRIQACEIGNPFLKVRLDPEKRRVRAVDSWVEESSQVDPKRILRLQVDLDRSENEEKILSSVHLGKKYIFVVNTDVK